MKGWEVAKALEEGKKMRIKSWVSGKYISLRQDGMILDEKDKPLDLLAYAFFNDGGREWEEYIEPFKVGDLVYCFDNSKIFEIKSKDIIKTINAKYYRHATQEEINQEKERRKWESIGRKVNEYKVGDIIEMKEGMGVNLWVISSIETIDGFDEVEYKDFEQNITQYCSSFDIKRLVCPVENRFDIN